MSENLFAIDGRTSEGKSTVINVRTEEDFIQKGKITKLEIPEDERWLHVEFTNDKGLTANKNFFFPKDNGDAEKYKTSVRIFMGNIANIGRKYKGGDYSVTGNSAVEVARKMIKDVAPMLNGKEVYCLMELNEGKDGKIYTNVGAFGPFSETGKDIFVSQKQKEMLVRKLNYKNSDVKPDADKPVEFKTTDAASDLPF